MRASASSVSPPLTRSRSARNSSSVYVPVRMSVGASCAQRKLRVCRLLPPRKCARRALEHDARGRRPAARRAPRTARRCRRRPPPTSYSGVPVMASPRVRTPRAAQHGTISGRSGGEDQRAADRTRHEHRRVAFADGHRPPKLQLRQRAEDQTEHRRDERHVVDTHGAARPRPRDREAEIEQRAVQAVRAERCQHQNASRRAAARHQHHAGPNAHERKIQHQQHHVADVEARDQRPHEVGTRREQQRPRLQPVLLKGREHHRRRRRRRKTKRQQRNQHAGRRGVVRGLRPRNALDRAVAELSGSLLSRFSSEYDRKVGITVPPTAARRAESRSPFRAATPSTTVATRRELMPGSAQRRPPRARRSVRHAWYSVSPTANSPMTRITTSMPSSSCGMPNEKRALPVS